MSRGQNAPTPASADKILSRPTSNFNMTTQMSVTAKSVISSIDGIKIYAEAIGDPQKPALVYIHGVSLAEQSSQP